MNNTMLMKVCRILLTLALISLAVAGAIPKEHKNRAFDKELSEEDHFDEEEEHNQEYDHEAFLGKDVAKEFDELTPEESKERLGKIFEKIDKDMDGQVSEAELQAWIKHVQGRYIIDDTNRQWKEHELNVDGQLSWKKYKKRTYGELEKDYVDMLLDRADPDWEPGDTDSDTSQYAEMVKRDERRWKMADQNKDEELSKEEFADFLHPEEAEHMKDIVVEETLEDIDKDNDRKISMEEYIGDMWPEREDDEEEPEWVTTEREQFTSFRDKNGDGFMDVAEVKDWVMPDDYDHTEAESKHLMFESDQDRDGLLTKDEVLDKFDLFVGSQATDFGEALTRHDEF